MPSEITIDSLNCQGTKYITVSDPTGEPDGSDNLKFINVLSGNPEATVTVYAAGDKGGTALDFCEGDDPILVPGQGGGSNETECKVQVGEGVYQYEITADGHEPLDPVIIVEPKIGDGGFSLQFLATSAGAATVVAVLVVATVAAYKMGMKKGANG